MRFRALVLCACAAVALTACAVLGLRPPRPLAVPRQGVVLADVTIVNPGGGARAHQTLRASGSTIDSISEYSPAEDAPAQGNAYADSYVLPGLIDMHVHHPTGRLETDIEFFDPLHLSHGVTTVRDCASIDGSLSALATLEAVVADGRLYPRRVLEGAIARYRDYYHGWLFDRLTMLLFPLFASPPGE